MGRRPAQASGDQRLIGSTIARRYALVRLLGDGGMGAVYKAEDNVLRRFVALKLLHPAAAANPAAVERFLREAQAAASIGHPNIIDILDFGEADGKPYLVMEYLRGRSLADALHTDGPMPVKQACAIATHALAGLQAAHDRGILHRDLKPANLMMVVRFGDRSFVKLLDFGFAALLGQNVPADKTLTPARTLVGTPAYAAPERLRGDDRRDPRTDLYSLGVVLFEMLAGVRPFDAPTFSELARKVQKEPPPPLRLYRPDAPEGLEKVIARALAKKSEDRWKDAEAFAAALVPFGGRVVETDEDGASDSLTMDLIKIRGRERLRGDRATGDIPAVKEPSAVKPEAYERRKPAVEVNDAIADPEDPVLVADSADLKLADIALDVQGGEEPTENYGSGAFAEVPTVQDNPALRPNLGPRAQASALPPPAAKAVAAPTEPGASRPKPIPKPPPPPRKESRTFEGSAGVSILRFVSRRYGERALKDVLKNLPEKHRKLYSQGISAGQWLPSSSMFALAEGIDATLGRADLHLVADCGRAVAEGSFELMRDLGPPAPPPELLLAEMPGLLGKLMTHVECRVRSVGRGYGRLELDEMGQESSLTHCVMFLGFLDRSLSRFGAREVEVNLLNCRYLGDDENLYDISWLIT